LKITYAHLWRPTYIIHHRYSTVNCGHISNLSSIYPSGWGNKMIATEVKPEQNKA